jgi:hypothetical protein
MSECAQCGTNRIKNKSPSGNKDYTYCPNCVAFNQQVYVHSKLSNRQLEEKERSAKEKLARTLAAIKAVRKSRGVK